jgi:cytochrome P450
LTLTDLGCLTGRGLTAPRASQTLQGADTIGSHLRAVTVRATEPQHRDMLFEACFPERSTAMLQAPESADVERLPLAPKNPLPYRHQLRAVRSLIDGFQELLDAGGPVTRIVLAPKWLLPTAVLIASPQGARDVLGRTDEIADRGGTRATIQMYRLMGCNLQDLPHHQWLPRRRTLQPMFTRQHVPRYAGHMAAAAQTAGTTARR